MKRPSGILACVLIAGIIAPALHAQKAGVIIQPQPGRGIETDPGIVEQAEALRVAGKLLPKQRVIDALAKPANGAVKTEPPSTRTLSGGEIAERARAAQVRVGWYYLCPRCEKWHLNLADGYAISADGAVATCHHCVAPGPDIREGFLVTADASGKVLPATGVIAANKELDAAVIRVEGLACRPLALQDDIAPGDRAYLYSDPLGNRGYFSEGIVNRFYWKKGTSGDPTTFADAVRLRFNAGTDWAPGSSGGALLDSCGNAIGHVSTISVLGNRPAGKDGRGGANSPMITLHEAVPARGVILMLREAAKKAD